MAAEVLRHTVTERVSIRFCEPSDARAIQAYASDKKISASSHVPYPYPQNGGETFVKDAVESRISGQTYAFSVFYEGDFAGIVSLLAVNAIEETAELGYWIAVPFWGKGIATDAVHQAICYATTTLNLSTMYSECLASNLASARVLEKNGFIYIEDFTIEGPPEAPFTGQQARRFRLTRNEWIHGQYSR